MNLIFFKTIFILAAITSILGAPYDSHDHSSNSNETDSNSIEEDRLTPTSKKSFLKWYNEMDEQIRTAGLDVGLFTYIKKVDENCVKRKLKLSENGDKIVNFPQFFIPTSIAFVKCFDKSENAGVVELINIMLESNKYKNFKKYSECYFNELQKLEPTSKLVENFDANQMMLTEEECDIHLGKNALVEIMTSIEEFTGKFSTFTCGNLNRNEITKLKMTLHILRYENNEELKNSEVEKLKEIVATKLDNIFECVMNSF